MFIFLSVKFFDSSMEDLLLRIKRSVLNDEHIYICETSVHGLIEAQRRPEFQQILNHAGFNVPDGMPIVWAGIMMGKKGIERIYGPKLMENLCALSEKMKWKIFLYGTTDSTLDLLSKKLKRIFPKLIIVGRHAPPFRALLDVEKNEIYQKINSSQAHVVFVGLSTPKQELWMYEAKTHLNADILVGGGAAFDFIAGIKPQAPIFMQRNGLEWLFRLFQEPRRLWKRYLINNTLFCYYCFRSIFLLRK